MKQRFLSACFMVFAIIMLTIGCGGGGSSGSSISSGWLGVTDPNAAGKWQIEIQPSAVAIRPEQTISLSVLVKDAYGHPLDGVKVLFSSQLGGKFEDENADTKNGWVSNKFTAGKQQGTEAIVVVANDISVSKSLLVQAAAGNPPVSQIITSEDTTLAGNIVTVAVGATIDGSPASGLEAALSSTIAGRFGDSNGKIENGWFTTTFTSDKEASGVGTITAMINGVKTEKSLSVVKEKIASPVLKISVNPDAVFLGQSATVIVISKDESGAASNARINLSASLAGSFYPREGTPNSGVFFSEFTAGNEVGSAALTVFSGESSASAILSIEKPEIVMSITPSKDSVKVDERVPVSLLVTDTFSRPISSAKIFLSAELGCECDDDTGSTNSDGYFFFEFIASQTAGLSHIHALTAGATATAQITVVGP
ncbi:MAG: hypothetical protein PHD82_03640 [Candidatus Riflebacteria bacterium]|nr:hypothetical protein [Candidatus Riflebacteria bacterium]